MDNDVVADAALVSNNSTGFDDSVVTYLRIFTDSCVRVYDVLHSVLPFFIKKPRRHGGTEKEKQLSAISTQLKKKKEASIVLVIIYCYLFLITYSPVKTAI